MSDKVTTQSQASPKPSTMPIAGGMLQRACACGQHNGSGGECEHCKEKHAGMLQRAAINSSSGNGAPPIVHEVLRSPGQPLDAGTRAFMESRFEHDFSGVRVHTGAQAAESARAVNAHAYTVGRDVVFGAGQYAPQTSAGQRLMAHELAHVVQQHGLQAGIIQNMSIQPPNDRFEQNAEMIADQIIGGQSSSMNQAAALDIPTAPISLRRQVDNAGQLYTITLRPGLAIENAPLEIAQRFLRTQLLARLRGHADGKREQHQYLVDLRKESIINEYLVAPVSETLGGVDMPPLNMWEMVNGVINAVEAEINAGRIERALYAARVAEEAYARAARRVQDYLEGVTTGGERAVTGLEFVRDASVVVVGAAATVATGGVAAGALVGTSYATALTVTQQATEVGLGLRKEINWNQIAFDALLGFVLSYAGGRIGGAIAGRIIGSNPAAASLGRLVVSRIVSNTLVGRGSALVNVAAQSLYAVVRGQPMTPEQFSDRLAEQLSLKGALMDIIYGEIAHQAVSAATRPSAPPPGTPDNLVSLAERRAALMEQQSRRQQQGTTSQKSRQPSRTVGLAADEGGPARQLAPFVEPESPQTFVEPEPAQVLQFPTTAGRRGQSPSSAIASGQATGVGLGAASAEPEEEESRSRRCTIEEIAPKFGRRPCHSDFAKTFSGTRREFRVTESQGVFVDFDAKRGPILYEVKTGYGWMLNPNLSPEWQRRREQVLERFHEQAYMQMYIASKCGYELDWYFNSQSVAEYFQSLLEPPVKWKTYNCDTDSDHTW